MQRILIVDDEETLCEVLKINLENEGYDVDIALSAEEALTYNLQDYSLILLDIMMGEISGIKMARMLKADVTTADIPIIFCTARDTEDDMVMGLNLGADDYIIKPFSFPVLYAKANSLLKRLSGNDSLNLLTKGNITIDKRTNTVLIAGEKCHLPKLQYQILLYFLENPNRILSREQILIRFWGYDFDGNERVVDNQIKKLRKALDKSDCKITTVHKAGYKLEVPYEKEKKQDRKC